MSTSTSLFVPRHECNKYTITLVDLSAFKFLETFSVGSGAFKYATTLLIDGLFKLRTIVILYDSFSIITTRCESNVLHKCRINNCKDLKSINIGPTTFNDFSGGLELTNLPQLESLTIGDDYNGYHRFTFCYANFYLRSTLLLYNNM